MGKLKILMMLATLTIVGGALNAQSADLKFDKGETYRSYQKGHTADTIEGVDVIGKTIFLNPEKPYNYDIVAEADSMAADSTCDFTLYGSINGTGYYAIDTITWSMSSADTVVLFQSAATVRWRFLWLTLSGNDTGTKARQGDIFIQKLETDQ